jgi:hypothetical protein
MTRQPSTPIQNSPRRRRVIRVLLGLFVLGLVLLGYFSTTRVEGVEFNPDTWQVRVFSFRADPWTNWQWTGVRRDLTTWSVDPAITAHLAGHLGNESERWDLAKISRMGRTQTGPAGSFVQLLTLQGYAGSNRPTKFFSNWSSQYPQRAQQLWPAIRELTLFGAYAQIPLVVELCLSSVDDDQFTERLKKEQAQALWRHAELLIGQKEFSGAESVAQAGLNHDPSSVQLKSLIDDLRRSASADQSHNE